MFKVGDIVIGTEETQWSLYSNKKIYRVIDVEHRNGRRMLTLAVLYHPYVSEIGKTYRGADSEFLVKVGATLV